ncbi:type VI immunity family protein [Azonexus caeni]|jgi:hypothetical protein|uniref:type VI immunity family protein n=1 Tax=Azonexus caeni TaxID=266126 RepID=UPI003A879F64
MLPDSYLKRLARVKPYAELWRDDHKFVEHRIGLYATFYFDHFHPMVDSNEAARKALIECWKDYWDLVGTQHQKWIYRFGSSIRGYKLPTDKVPPLDAYLSDPEKHGDYQYYVHGGKHEDDASDYLFSTAGFPVYGAPEYPKDIAYLELQAPLEYITNGKLSAFVELVKRCAVRLKVDQAHGGLGLLRTYNEETTTRSTEYQLSQVFSGVDVNVPYMQMSNLFWNEQGHLGIDSPHWLNVLGARWVEKLGGFDALKAKLPEDVFVVEPCGEGVFIQAGPYPEPGHKDDGLPPAYVWLNRVLLPVRAPKMVYCFGDNPGQLAQRQGAMPYFTRFDAASAKLPPVGGSDIQALVATLSASASSESKRNNVPANQPCPEAGWWFTPAQANSRRYFKQGEIMPSVGGDYGETFWQWSPDQSAPTL